MVIKRVALVLTTLLLANTVLADSYLKEEKSTNFIVTPSIGYRYDVFKWSILHHQLNMKVSELVWKNHIIQPSIKIETEPKANEVTFLGQAKYGYILKNQSRSWDYDWHPRRDETGNVVSKLTSTSTSQATGSVIDLSGAVGYLLNLFKDNLLTFYVGYDYTDYRNKNYGYNQLVYREDSMPSNELFQKYNFTTQSPWVGLSVNAPLNDKFSIIPTVKFYSFKHKGKAYWLFRPDLKQNPSFENKAKGRGLGFDVDFIYKYSDNLDFKVNLATKKFKMKSGRNQMFFNKKAFNGERIANIKLFNLSLKSSAISAGFNYKL